MNREWLIKIWVVILTVVLKWIENGDVSLKDLNLTVFRMHWRISVCTIRNLMNSFSHGEQKRLWFQKDACYDLLINVWENDRGRKSFVPFDLYCYRKCHEKYEIFYTCGKCFFIPVVSR